jgi:hypothetical protein
MSYLIKSDPPRSSIKNSHLFFEGSRTELLDFLRVRNNSNRGRGTAPSQKLGTPNFYDSKKGFFFTAKSRTWSTSCSPPFKSPELAIYPPKKSAEIDKNAKHRIAEEAHKERGRRTEKSRTFVPAAGGSRPAELHEARIWPPGRKERPRVEIYSHRFPIARWQEVGFMRFRGPGFSECFRWRRRE